MAKLPLGGAGLDRPGLGPATSGAARRGGRYGHHHHRPGSEQTGSHGTTSAGCCTSGQPTVVATSEPPTQHPMAGQSSGPAWTTDIPAMVGPGMAIPGAKATPLATPAGSPYTVVSTQPKQASATT